MSVVIFIYLLGILHYTFRGVLTSKDINFKSFHANIKLSENIQTSDELKRKLKIQAKG